MFILRRNFLSFSSQIVTPPFLYGNRHPRIAGLIRFDDDLSLEARRVLQNGLLWKNKFFSKINPNSVKFIEIVSDDTVGKSNDPNLIESGTGAIISTDVKFPNQTKNFSCGIAIGFEGVGIYNDSKQYHANQVKTYANEFFLETPPTNADNARLILSCLEISEDNTVDLLPNHQVLTEVVEVVIPRQKRISNRENYKLKQLEETMYNEIYSPCIIFANQINDSEETKFIGMYDLDEKNLLCGGTIVEGENLLVDPFVTFDCPEGKETEIFSIFANLANVKKLIFSSSDKFMTKLVGSGDVRYVVSGQVLSENGDDEQFVSLLQRRPWVLRGLLT